MVTRTHLTPWRTFDIMKNKLWTCKTDMPASFACTTSCYHLYQAKLLHMLLILSSGDVAVHHPSNPTWQHWPYPLPGSLYQFSYTSLEICHPLYELCCPSLEQWQPPWGREQCCLWLEWCSMSLDWCCPALDWCRPSWQQCLLLLGEQSPLRLEWYLCHPSDPVRWHQICGRRSPPPGLKLVREGGTHGRKVLQKCCHMILPSFQNGNVWSICILGGVREGSRLIGCVFASSRAISTRIEVKAVAWWWGIVWRCWWMTVQYSAMRYVGVGAVTSTTDGLHVNQSVPVLGTESWLVSILVM